MPIANSKKRSGTVLLEAVIAIGVILVGVVGSLVLLNTSISLGRANQDKIVAQNLAREGMELAYSLRNSGSLRHVDDPTTTWASYLLRSALKVSDQTSFLTKYNLGEVIDAGGGVHECRQRCSALQTAADPTHCVATSDDENLMFGGGPYAPTDLTADEALACDIAALIGYLYTLNFPNPPNACMSTNASADRIEMGTTGSVKDCDYDGQGGLDISDLTALIDALFLQSYQFSNAYPTIAFGSTPDAQFTFYNPIYDGNLDSTITSSTYGKYPIFQKVWDNPDARVYTLNSSNFVQKSVTGAQPSKFYRVVSLQPVCRGTPPSGTDTEFVVPQDYALNCADYQVRNGWTNSAKVGVLVTSEVRWPTATNATKVKYQEFLYDWITL